MIITTKDVIDGKKKDLQTELSIIKSDNTRAAASRRNYLTLYMETLGDYETATDAEKQELKKVIGEFDGLLTMNGSKMLNDRVSQISEKRSLKDEKKLMNQNFAAKLFGGRND